MTCSKCKRETPQDAFYCPYCGFKLGEGSNTTKRPKTRGNGTGSVFRLPNGRWMAQVVLGYYTEGDTADPASLKQKKKTRSKCFATKREAVNALPTLHVAKPQTDLTLQQLFDRWLPTHKAGDATINCYKAAIKHFDSLKHLKLDAITIDDLQDCLDACGHGKRTQENMRAALGLAYKYGIPRHYIPDDLNLASYLRVGGEAAAKRDSFTDAQIAQIRKAGTDEAETVLCLIYLGFRPSEFLALTAASYDAEHNCIVGGSKTDAGRNRVVTVSPKIAEIIKRRVDVGGYIAGRKMTLREFTEQVFYPALEQAGIDNPIVTIAGDAQRHKFTPHSCRHTFATLMKRAAGSDKDKLALIGHASSEQLRDYQDVHWDDLRKITDAI